MAIKPNTDRFDTHYLVSVATYKACQCHIDLLEYKLNTLMKSKQK